VGRFKSLGREDDLAQVVLALGATRGFARGLDSRECQANEQGDGPDDDEQLESE
jgi:hypothetical protein